MITEAQAIDWRNQDPPVTWDKIATEMELSSGAAAHQKVERYKKRIEKQGPPVPQSKLDKTIEGQPMIPGGPTLKEKKASTSPWNADHNPWTMDMLYVHGKKERERLGIACRFVNTTRAGNIEKKLYQGWEYADIKNYPGGVRQQIVGESQHGNQIWRRELVLMELPPERVAQRKAYHKHKNERGLIAAKNIAARQAKKLAEEGTDMELMEVR